MAQKDKVKELVGRGLDSYHAKALQQMDRIEKKNKEQNHKISILSNELDNDYLTKIEEGSVVSLEHSKEGMVYLDELQGNTLVNYCTDGSKELTLNGDIDLEGTFVTTTEGVDNGLVDVMCEGNTLVNLANIKSIYENTNLTGYYADGTICETSLLKLNTAYTLIIEKEFLDGHNINYKDFEFGVGNSINVTNAHPTMTNGSYSMSYNTDKYETKIVTVSFADFKGYKYLTIRPCRRATAPVEGEVGKYKIKIIFLEGDWTNKKIPSHFEGMKSVGQDDENGHKIEILSSKNLAPSSTHKFTTHGIEFNFGSKTINENVYVHNISNKDIMVHTSINQNYSRGFRVEKNSKKLIELNEGEVIYCTSVNRTDGWRDSDVEKARNSFIITKKENELNKKEILLNEPLRSIENINKDRIVKIGNKLFIERNLAQITLDGTENWIKWAYETPLTQLDTHLHCTIRIANIKYYSKECANIVTDKFKSVSTRGTLGEYIYHDGWNDTICIKILQSKLETPDASGFKKWLQNNPIELIYELATPIYEPLEIEPILNTYTDITHISNNSLIPCNMKVKNSGYNAIIKPSTLYTIALDTNKSGTIGMNLGGAKGTTTNNVLTLTTPATLTDDSLRLYGKGIKGSKVRLLEGDKTNWIPSHFEGMKSSFEDKVQEDGSYKMEILSNNENLIDMFSYRTGIRDNQEIIEDKNNNSITVKCNNMGTYNKISYRLYLKEGEKIYVSYKGTRVTAPTNQSYFDFKRISNGDWYITGTSNPNGMVVTANRGTGYYDFNFYFSGSSVVETDTVTFKDIMISKVDNNFVLHKSNKIQFSSIEPLRGVDNIKDKFVFKDGKLMIERNCSKYTTVGTENWLRHDYSNSNKIFAYAHVTSMNDRKAYTNIYCNNFATYLKSAEELKKQNNEYIWKGNDAHSALWLWISNNKFDGVSDINKFKTWIKNNPITVTYQLAEPIYEEIPFELQKIILEGYENGTLFFDTNIPPTSTVTYAGETPIVKSVKLNKTEVLNNTTDINDNIIPYLMDMDYRVVCLELATETQGISMARLFGGVYEMLKRDILSNRYSIDEYKHRLDVYLGANKITEEEYNKLGDMLNE